MSDLQAVAEKNAVALEELRAKFAAVTRSVDVNTFDWRALMESGALASLSVSRYRGTKSLTAADLGLAESEVSAVAEIVELGHRLLLPREVLNQFNSVETRARQVLRSYGLLTPLGLFLPAKSYDLCAASIADSKVKFENLVSKLIDDLPSHRAVMADQYDTLARQVWDRLCNSGSYPSVSRYDFFDGFVDRCMALFPSAAELENSFSFGLRLEFVPLPYQSQTEQPNFTAANDDLVRLRREVITQQTAAREQLVSGFVESVQTELFTLCNSALGDVLASVKANGALQSRSVVQLRNLVEKIGQLNFWQDRRLETIQAEISALLEPTAKRDLSLNTAILAELETQTRVIVLGLAKEDKAGLVLPVPSAAAVVLPTQPATNPIVLPSAAAAVAKSPALKFGGVAKSSPAAAGKLF